MAENGAAITALIAEFLMMTMNYYSCRDVIKKIFRNKETMHNIITVIIGLVAIVVICIFVEKTFSNIWIHIILSVTLAMIGYETVLLVLKIRLLELYFINSRQRSQNNDYV